MPSLFSPPKPPALSLPLPLLPTRADPAIAKRRRASLRARSLRKGRGASIIAGELLNQAPLSQPKASAASESGGTLLGS